MNKLAIQQRRAGFAAFFISGICAISSGVVVSLLQEEMGFAYGTTGTLLAMMNIGNLAAGFAVAFLSNFSSFFCHFISNIGYIFIVYFFADIAKASRYFRGCI